MKYIINGMNKNDLNEVSYIHQRAIDSGESTFATKTYKSWHEWTDSHICGCSFVARGIDSIYGWGALSAGANPLFGSGVANVSIYVKNEFQNKGIGQSLLRNIIGISEHNEIWTIHAYVFPENIASIKMNINCGFREVGAFEKVSRMTLGKFAGTWRDVLLFERRSKVVCY